ncbi:Atxe2 family lasso peptide isopeptidase [Pseudoxanthomonas yeongjuensis]|uniref:Atxe2 family lasso peptide isopeptidase n=1 Tax=Pseudoxanthomonas yeongjuensis TaxID=377616 RepID=UPI001FE7969B|nr:Atxe2 family lasso peptide isopeptidase [Pseudoxanthomonas yeongjuensis]
MSTIVLAVGVATTNLAHAEAISPRRLLEVADLGNPVISPDGRQVAFRVEQASIERNTYDSIWYVQDLEGASPPRRVADGGVPLRQYSNGLALPSPAVWSPDGRWIYYRARLDGRVSVWRAAADGSQAYPVTFDPADVRDFSLSHDGRMLKYSVGATRDEVIAAEELEYDRGVRIDDTVVIAAGLFRSSKIEDRPATQRFMGDWFSTGPLLAKTPDRWRAVDLATLSVRDLTASEAPVRAPTVADLPLGLPKPLKLAPHPDDGRIALLTPATSNDPGLLPGTDVELAMLTNRRSSRPVHCTAELCSHQTITDIQWRPGTDEVLFTATDRRRRGRTQSIYGWDVSTGRVRPIVLSEGLVSGGQRYWDVPCGLSSDTLVCIAAEADRPPRLEAIDVSTGDRRILFEPNKGLETDIAVTAPARLIHWTDERGREFTGQLFEPRNTSGPPPLFVTFYNCYGFLRGGVGDEWPLASLAENGIAALCINAIPEYRLDFVERHDQGRSAVESVVRHLSAAGQIDPTRVGMGGLSYGSEVTLWTAANSDVLAAASVSGVSSTPTYYLFNSLRDAFRSTLRQSLQLGALEETPGRWREISPVFHLDRIRIPILFQMPEQEYRMTLDYALPLMQRNQGDIYAFPDEAHIKFQPRHKLAVYERNLDWFRFWLQDYEDPGPLKAEQYRIWRRMKDEMAAHSAGTARHGGV